MNYDDYIYLCTAIGNLSGIPIRMYENDKKVLYHSLVSLPKDPIAPYENAVIAIDAHVGYYVTPFFNYYGVVNCFPYKIVIGPSGQSNMNDQVIKELALRCDVVPDEVEDFTAAMKSIVQMPLPSILQILCTMNYVMNEEKLSLEDITIYDSEQQGLNELVKTARADQAFRSGNRSQQAVHNTLALEQTLVDIVRKGDTAALREWMRNAPAVSGGTLASDQLRQLKNTFIVTATLVSRAAIRGGMDVNDAFSLSDAYIRQCELLFNMDRITNLQYHMVLAYTEQVEKLRKGKYPSKLVIDVSNYIQHHLSEPTDIEALAKAMFFSRTYLAAKFKKETGSTLTDFILREKTEEAKRLLRYTDKPVSSIAAYLGFSSQSHFANVFKKYTDKTPNEYRVLHNK